MTKPREQVKEENRWNVEALYPDLKTWEEAYNKASRNGMQPAWPELEKFKGHLVDNASVLKEALDKIMEISREITKIYTYAHLRHDEDIANDTNKSAYGQASALYFEFEQSISWFEPELLSLPEATMHAYLSATILAPYRFHLEKILRIKKHTLSKESEELLAMSAKALNTSQKAFGAINDADFSFGTIKNSKGEDKELTHASYGIYIRDQDRTLRENAFKQLHGKFMKYENTLCELINGQMEAHLFNSRARRYSSCLEAALFPKNIDTSVYHSLIQAVNEKLGVLHKYIALRRRVLNIGQLHLYDMYVPLTSQIDIQMPYQEAEKVVIDSVAPLGSEYQNLLRQGFLQQRWVDRFENKNKRSGAYSSGCYDSMPYILMNYKDLLKDVFTLAHEAGHSMHSLLSHTKQPYQYANYPIFLAEVASTFNEDLLTRYLIERAKSKEEKIFLLNQKIEDIRGTLFRQTMFAEFELLIHDLVEKNVPLTPKHLKDEYKKLNAKYFGPSVIIDEEAEIEWARIPHFYYNFYVYQYATGISAALALAERVMNGGEEERNAYLSFLSSGCSKYPIDILEMAGVNMRSPEPVKAAIDKFDRLVDELESLLF